MHTDERSKKLHFKGLCPPVTKLQRGGSHFGGHKPLKGNFRKVTKLRAATPGPRCVASRKDAIRGASALHILKANTASMSFRPLTTLPRGSSLRRVHAWQQTGPPATPRQPCSGVGNGEPTPTLLSIVANDARMQLDQDEQIIKELFPAVETHAHSVEEIRKGLSQKPDIIVYSGHADRNGLLIDPSSEKYTDACSFATMIEDGFGAHASPACILLSSCNSSGLALELSSKLPSTAIVYWDTLVLTEAARWFMKAFLTRLKGCYAAELKDSGNVVRAYNEALLRFENESVYSIGDPMQWLRVDPGQHQLFHAQNNFPVLKGNGRGCERCRFCNPQEHGLISLVLDSKVATNPVYDLGPSRICKPQVRKGDLNSRRLEDSFL